MPITCRPASHVISDALEGDRIVIDIQTGAYYTLTAQAAELWSQASDHGEVADVADPVLARLVAEGLLVAEAAAPAAEPSPTEAAFTRYNDMEELLLVDPIHEVDNEGWPVFKRPDA